MPEAEAEVKKQQKTLCENNKQERRRLPPVGRNICDSIAERTPIEEKSYPTACLGMSDDVPLVEDFEGEAMFDGVFVTPFRRAILSVVLL